MTDTVIVLFTFAPAEVNNFQFVDVSAAALLRLSEAQGRSGCTDGDVGPPDLQHQLNR